MAKYYKDNHITFYNKDCRQMTELPDESVQCVVTSPPYWGLRKYAGDQDLIWGDNHCEHQWALEDKQTGQKHWNQGGQVIPNAERVIRDGGIIKTGFCSLCGAWKGAFGLEPTPEMYIQHSIEILREIRRVLRKDGVVFWNIGDSYAGSGGDHQKWLKNNSGFWGNTFRGVMAKPVKGKRIPRGSGRWGGGNIPASGALKPKDLCLIPFRLAIAAQEDGWWVRSVIIWSKPNPMPESVTDRPTESHEYILMLTKSARYYWDADAVRREYTEPLNRWGGPEFRKSSHKYIEMGEPILGNFGATSMYREGRPVRPNEAGANIRSVWEFTTQPYPEAHFVVFPEKLPETCIKAATPEVGCCSKCGKPWVRVTEHQRPDDYDSSAFDEKTSRGWGGKEFSRNRPLSKIFKDSLNSKIITKGWQPTCSCNADKIPSLVLDPFMGTGTTLWVAKKLNRRAVGYDTSQEYCELAVKRNRQQVLGI